MQTSHSFRVAVIGSGVAGSICALRLAEAGLAVDLFEQGPELVNGPPVCHLHAGGSLYRELNDQQCMQLLEQSIYTARSFEQSLRKRPTLIAIPQRDPGEVTDLIPRFEALQAHYQTLIDQDPANEILGSAEDYFKLIDEDQTRAMRQYAQRSDVDASQDELLNALQSLELDKLKFPLIVVQEYGVSVIRVAASVELAAAQLPLLNVHVNTQVTQLQSLDEHWELTYGQGEEAQQQWFDYVVNAAGYRSGAIDDLIGIPAKRLVEFKAAYIAQWPEGKGVWPEIVIHGQRGTKHGMAQFTPYGGGIFQLHGMTQDITLFEQGVAQSSEVSAQPKLCQPLLQLAQGMWPTQLVQQRTEAAIHYLAEFIPAFAQAQVVEKTLSGAQQIPGDDVTERVSGARFAARRYARAEVIKFSSTLACADEILTDISYLTDKIGRIVPSDLNSTLQLTKSAIDELAEAIALRRHFPIALGRES